MVKVNKSRFLRYWGPTLDALRNLGGSGTPREVFDEVINNMSITETELQVLTKSGEPVVENDIRWVRLYLKEAGLIDASQRRVWRLTQRGESTHLDEASTAILFSQIQKSRTIKQKSEPAVVETDIELEEQEELSSLSLIERLLQLSPSGFEMICKRILREAGFSQVFVTGKSGDGGIDGDGILQVNELVSFRVLFQCKRFRESVGSGVVRDFRGAMQGRADKGIILTTGSFTRDARNEAKRDGAPPIELVDGARLVELMQRLNLGVKPKTVYEIDESYFSEYS